MPHCSVNGLRLYYEWRGPEDAPKVVFVNGLLTDTSSWEPIVGPLSAQFRCLLYDCRGQGRSDTPDQPHTTPQHTADLAALLEELGVAQCSVVGLSNGGAAALDLAGAKPEQVCALVVAGAYAWVDSALRAKLGSWISAMAVGGSPLRFDVATPWVWGDTFLNQQYERLLPFREKGANLPTTNAHNLITGALEHDVRALLPLIRAATLVVVGDEDTLTPAKQARAFASMIPNAEVALMPDSGHAAALERPADFAALVGAFLKEHAV